MKSNEKNAILSVGTFDFNGKQFTSLEVTIFDKEGKEIKFPVKLTYQDKKRVAKLLYKIKVNIDEQ